MTLDVHFTSFEILQVSVPARPEMGIPASARFDSIPLTLVVGRTNLGFEALGESSRVDGVEAIERTLRQLLHIPLNDWTPSTRWMRDSHETGFVSGMMRTRRLFSWEACEDLSMFLLESLWLDAMGRAAGAPAHVLLGGAVRRRVKADFWAAQPDAQELAALVAKAHGFGCRGLKMKSDPEGNTAFALAEIARDVPANFEFTIDPMFNWRSLHQSRRIFETLSALGLTIRVEDPFPFEVIEDWQMARQRYSLPIIWHTRSEEDLRIALREQTADAFNIACRSAHEAVYLSHVLAFHKKDCWFGSQLESGIFQQVRLHSACVAPTCVLASDLQSQWVREHCLVDPPMTTMEGYAEVSDSPGLGVELNRDAVARFLVRRWTVE